MRPDQKIPVRASHILNFFALGLALIFVRVWFLTVIQKEALTEESLKPKRRTVSEHVERATIRDRFNIPLAINKVQYNAAVCYAQIREIPRFTWVREGGERVKNQTRLNYIQDLAKNLALDLSLDEREIEDTIHSKASLFPHTPFIIKEEISEKEYYRLKMLERKWHGVTALRSSKRYYPYKGVGADIIGYLGAISENEYWKIGSELKTLKEYVKAREAGELTLLPKGYSSPLEVRKRLGYLQNKSYTINDLVGKGGIEKALDEELRGKRGRKRFEIDTNGNLASHPSFNPNDFIATGKENMRKKPIIQKWLESDSFIGHIWDGKRPITKELFDHKKKEYFTQSSHLTWNTYLNTILNAKSAIAQAIKKADTIQTAIALQNAATRLLTLSNQDNMRSLFDVLYSSDDHIPTRNETNEQTKCSIRLYLGDHLEEIGPLRSHLDHYLASIPHNDDKLLLLDLSRLAANQDDFTPSLLEKVGPLPLSTYRAMSQTGNQHRSFLHQEIRTLFHEATFTPWHEEHFKKFLKDKRKKEKERKRAAKPYTDYLLKEERAQFTTFWNTHKETLLYTYIVGAPPQDALEELKPYLTRITQWREGDEELHQRDLTKTLSELSSDEGILFLSGLHSFNELTTPLWGRYPRIKNDKGAQLTKHLARAFYPTSGFGYGRSFAFRQSTPAGSVFKVITGYEALRQKYLDNKKNHKSLSDINPLTLVDSLQWAPKKVINSHILGYWCDGTPIKRLYKRGLLPRGHANIGKIDLPGAFEHSSNIYFSILAGDHLDHPTDLVKAAKSFGYGEKTGIDLPGEIRGNLPDDLADNRTGLYSFAIGQHSLVGTPLQTAVMLSAFTNNGALLKPKIVHLLASVEPSEKKPSLFHLPNYAFSDPLSLVGISFPLFTEAKKSDEKPFLHISDPEFTRTLFLPHEIKSLLMQGMYRTVHGDRGTARNSLMRARHKVREASKTYSEMHPYLIGKTGTAEFYFKPTLDSETKAVIKNNIWFGSIAYPEPISKTGPWNDPELIIVIYLQHGDTGRNAAPMAAQILKKWREIKKNRGI